jgi:hypothetical protein
MNPSKHLPYRLVTESRVTLTSFPLLVI